MSLPIAYQYDLRRLLALAPAQLYQQARSQRCPFGFSILHLNAGPDRIHRLRVARAGIVLDVFYSDGRFVAVPVLH